MVQAYQIRRTVIILLAVVLAVFAVVWMANLARRSFSSDGADAARDAETIVLTDYDTSSSRVRLLYDGAVISREEHRALRITVSADQRVIEILRGYDGDALKRKTYPNTLAAYQTFIRAINYEGFSSAQNNKLGDDERGICPAGRRTVTELFEDGDSILRLWSATCSRKLGTLSGDSPALLLLFKNQIPDYSELTRGIRF